MTRVRTTITSTVLAAAFAAGLAGAALAADNQRNQAQRPTASNTMTSGQNNGTSSNISTWAAAYAVQVYQKCKDNILPECPSAE